jgi:hypothetical protein
MICVLAMAVAPAVARPCTGFAVYADRTLFGMNFDYDKNVEVRLLVDDAGGTRAFHLAFVTETGRVPRTAGMNEHGLFVSAQELHPMVNAGPPGPGEVCPGALYARALPEFERVSDVTTFLETREMVNCYATTLHLLFADPSGSAIIVEPGVDGHEITKLEGDRIVMTNFANCGLAAAGTPEVDPEQAAGFGADRYRAAHSAIDERFDGFDLEDAMDVLQDASWKYTRCSMVFNPSDGAVYVAVEGDFTKILRADIEAGTIETFSGYDESSSWPLAGRGVTLKELEGHEPAFLDRIIRAFTR